MASIYVTGTDTGVGKSLVSAALLHALRARGLHALGMKPVASGCTQHHGQWQNDDALALRAAGSTPWPDYALINPFALPEPTAPEIAAEQAGATVSLAPLVAAHTALAAQADWVVVEGVGGWCAPLAAGIEQSDLVAALGMPPVLLVVGIRLGCINHARLTARAVLGDGHALAGWIGSVIDPAMAHRERTCAILRRELPAPCLGVLEHSPSPDPAALATRIVLPMIG
ncbi:MAG: dethiobiotin synthase [Gammaproteobacteria bacterium HGW-Gammaproteobacteria-4]|jgi:dethiobiotin synthetase|nr:MAG: dethiobiotin synthase [Gammaproteobacteria bacterium HGW-Gammaproteobacteria-4]